jgi:predicted Ser/Thr protein kinase
MRRCSKCGATIPSGRASCPRCLLELAVSPGTAGEAAEETAPPRRRAPAPTPEELADAFPLLEIRELVGEGGMGVVYRARHKQLERDVALKILAPGAADEARFAERFLREARTLARLDHPGIVRIYDFGQSGGRWFLLMEFVEGTNLRRLMSEKRLSSRDTLAIVPQICDALQYAHDEGVVHRDVKPENVLIDVKGRVKLVDFGLAKLVGGQADAVCSTQTDAVMGTLSYMAPEQRSRPRDVDHRADIFSLGVVFYEMLTGEVPAGRFAPPSQRVQVDVRLDAIVLKSLESQPERRYQHAVDVRTDVDDLATDPWSPAEDEAEERRVEETVAWRRPRVLAALAALALVAWLAWWRLFEHGLAALIPISLVLGALACAAVVRRRTTPADPARDPSLFVYLNLGGVQKRHSRPMPPWLSGRTLAALLLFALGCVAWVFHNVATWERGTTDYRQSVGGSAASSGWGATNVARLAAEMRPGSDALAQLLSVDALDAPHWLRQEWYVALAVGLWCASALTLLMTRKNARRWGIVRDQVLFAAGATLVAALAIARFEPSMPAPLALAWDQESRADLETTTAAVRLALLERGYQVEARSDWDVVDRATGARVGRAVVLDAQDPSPFDRWRVDLLDGPYRASPHFDVSIVSLDGGEGTRARWDLGYVRSDQARRFEADRTWMAELGERLARE